LYVVLTIFLKGFGLALELYPVLQILSVSMFERICLIRVVAQTEGSVAAGQLQMFTSWPDTYGRIS